MPHGISQGTPLKTIVYELVRWHTTIVFPLHFLSLRYLLSLSFFPFFLFFHFLHSILILFHLPSYFSDPTERCKCMENILTGVIDLVSSLDSRTLFAFDSYHHLPFLIIFTFIALLWFHKDDDSVVANQLFQKMLVVFCMLHVFPGGCHCYEC